MGGDGAHPAGRRLRDRSAADRKAEGGRSIEIVGFADSAVGLPALFEKSPLFSDAGLTAAITPDPREKREGFSLQAKIDDPDGQERLDVL